jgi:hypothetical protein
LVASIVLREMRIGRIETQGGRLSLLKNRAR